MPTIRGRSDDLSDQPTHDEWAAGAIAIRDGRTEPPGAGSLSFELAAQLGPAAGDDPLNDRAEEATLWCEKIMLAERRERLLAQYYGSGSEWLHGRLRGVIDDHVFQSNPQLPALVFSAGLIEAARAGVRAIAGLDLREPAFNLGGVIYGVIAALPAALAVFEPGNEAFTPATMYGYLKNDHKRWGNTCDWHISPNCSERRQFTTVFPAGNWLVYHATCTPCSWELANRI